ncbi:MAG TPA: hypothetical protein VGH28_33895 [Polyangiaceae bacterium]
MTDLESLSSSWNESGRAYYTEFSSRLAKLYAGEQGVDADMKDPRTTEMGDEAMRAVIELNAQGKWERARELFDPAYTPLLGWIKQSKRSFGFVTILGPDELLVFRGEPWSDGITFHLHGGKASRVEDVRGFCRSRNRDFLVLARAAGLEIRDARAGIGDLAATPIATLPWPEPSILPGAEKPLAIESLQVSDDGKRVVVSCYRQGILLGSLHAGEPAWTVLWPAAKPFENDGDDLPRAGDMTHVAISRDGTRLAFGCQDRGHFLATVGAGGAVAARGIAEPLSEYPHYACFSDDGRFVALNACHFYNGATGCFDWDASNDDDEQMPCIDGALRVYAAAWLDKPVVDAILGRPAKSAGSFALAGNGILRIVNLKGAVGVAQGFGSSAGSIDFCPESKRLALATYAGFVHVYDPYVEELPGRVDGVRPRRELTRWVLWEHLPNGPIRW